MATGDKNDLLITTSTLLPDNDTGEIEPADSRSVSSQIITHTLNVEELSTQEIKGPIEFKMEPTHNGVPLVNSITGGNEIAVDNTDPANPIINYNGLIFSFSVFTRDRVPATGGISASAASPTYLTGLEISEQTGGFELVTTGPWANTGAVLNNTGHGIDVLGTFSYFPSNTGGTSRIDMWSETSADGVTIIENSDSARSIEIGSSGESSGTKSSRFTNWPDGSMVRFAFTDTGGGSVAFEPLSVTSTQGTVSAPSFSFQETVVRLIP